MDKICEWNLMLYRFALFFFPLRGVSERLKVQFSPCSYRNTKYQFFMQNWQIHEYELHSFLVSQSNALHVPQNFPTVFTTQIHDQGLIRLRYTSSNRFYKKK